MAQMQMNPYRQKMTLVFVSSLLSRGLGRSFDSIPFQQYVSHIIKAHLLHKQRQTHSHCEALFLTAPAAPHPELDTLGRRRQCNDFWKKEHPRTLLHHADGPP